MDKADGSKLEFVYDAAGNRIAKKVTKAGKTATTHYVRDASGNVMGIYQDALLEEQPLYGSARLGSYQGGRLSGERRLGLKHYELSNHLGNVLAVISDNITLNATETLAKTLSTADYHPFGLPMEGRTVNFEKTRYGYNGKEQDADFANNYDYGFRIYNPGVGRFLSVDPLSGEFPWNSPYSFAEGSPVANIDLDGGEKLMSIEYPGGKPEVKWVGAWIGRVNRPLPLPKHSPRLKLTRCNRCWKKTPAESMPGSSAGGSQGRRTPCNWELIWGMRQWEPTNWLSTRPNGTRP